MAVRAARIRRTASKPELAVRADRQTVLCSGMQDGARVRTPSRERAAPRQLFAHSVHGLPCRVYSSVTSTTSDVPAL